MEDKIGRFRCIDSGDKATIIRRVDVPGQQGACACAHGSSEQVATQRFIAASRALRNHDQKPAAYRAPTSDELRKMTPTQRFVAMSKHPTEKRKQLTK